MSMKSYDQNEAMYHAGGMHTPEDYGQNPDYHPHIAMYNESRHEIVAALGHKSTVSGMKPA